MKPYVDLSDVNSSFSCQHFDAQTSSDEYFMSNSAKKGCELEHRLLPSGSSVFMVNPSPLVPHKNDYSVCSVIISFIRFNSSLSSSHASACIIPVMLSHSFPVFLSLSVVMNVSVSHMSDRETIPLSFCNLLSYFSVEKNQDGWQACVKG